MLSNIIKIYGRRLAGLPARNAKGERLLIYMGLIDILQNYRLLKKFEHAWKSVLHDGVRAGAGRSVCLR